MTSFHPSLSALTRLVSHSDPSEPVTGPSPLVKADDPAHAPTWASWLGVDLEQYASTHALGNYTVTRGPNPVKTFESMPLYVRLSMHLLFVGSYQVRLLKQHGVEELLRNESIRQGKIFDSSEGALEHIQEFVETYQLNLAELLEQDLTKYPNFNSFFYRRLLPSARPVASPSDPLILTSIADSRLTVFPSFDLARQIWVKGANFTLPTLVADQALSSSPHFANGASLAIFRLAPADYHRYHAPATGVMGPVKSLQGNYYTVNPQAVNENCDVFTLNRRDVTVFNVPGPTGDPVPVIIVAIGAMLVGSIAWTKTQGEEVRKGDELGYFAYGGSTVIALFPTGLVQFDEDLLKNSHEKLESVVKVGEQIGRFQSA